MFLHIVERLETLLSKLPNTIQKPILHELTPLKELFLQQRPPRFVLTGSIKRPAGEVLATLFGASKAAASNSIFRWQHVSINGHGSLYLLDARGATEVNTSEIQVELKQEPPDLILYLEEAGETRRSRKAELENLLGVHAKAAIGVIGVVFADDEPRSSTLSRDNVAAELADRLKEALSTDRVLETLIVHPGEGLAFAATLSRHVPNQARIEMIRISHDRAAQREVAQILVKSTSAICTAIGAQPIPLADLPILTTLQLVMVSGIMYLSGRERSLRAATEFLGAIGANVGAGMLLREGARVLLKFLPGWGNVVCGVVAGAGTYAIGRAATAFFLEGVSIKEARRTYLTSKRSKNRPQLPPPRQRKQKRPTKS